MTVPVLCPPIEVRGLVAGYGPRPVLDGIDLTLRRGRKILLLGPNGAGKTTLFRCLLGLLPARAGQVRLWGADPFDPRLRSDLMARCGVSLEAPRAGLRTTSSEWMRLHANLAGLTDPVESARRSLELWEIPADRLVEDLSLGERQRLETARTLLHEPTLLFLDEPTAHLDPGARDRFWSLLDAWCARRDASVLVSTHHLEEAADRGDEWVVLGRGRILHQGTPETFLEAFPCSRRLVLSAPLGADALRRLVDQACPGAQIASSSPEPRSIHRLRTPAGRQDLPAIVAGLCREGLGILALGEDGTSFREAYASCMEPSTVPVVEAPPPSDRAPAGFVSTVGAALRLHATGLARERRLLIPFSVMQGLLLAASFWLPSGVFSASLLTLAAVLPGGLAAGLASDLVAGERDRRYLETSLSLPVAFAHLVLGRGLSIFAFALGLSWVALGILGLSARDLRDLPAIGLLLAPGAMAYCVAMGTWVSVHSRSLRTASQLSTLASLPLIALAQGLPLVVEGNLAPWCAGGAALWAVAAFLALRVHLHLQSRIRTP